MENQERERQKRAKRFMFLLFANKNTPQEVINTRTLNFARRNWFLNLIELSDVQLSDAEFMRTLFETNCRTLEYVKPTKALYSNFDFMIDYLQKLYRFHKNQHGAKVLSDLPDIQEYLPLLVNMDFFSKLQLAFPKENIIETLCKAIEKKFEGKPHRLVQAKTGALVKIPKNVAITEAYKHGAEVLKRIPESHPNFLEIAEAAILHDGFKSLMLLDPTKPYFDIKLIKRAFHVEQSNNKSTGSQNKTLYKYLESVLRPGKTIRVDARHTKFEHHPELEPIWKAVMKDRELSRAYQAELERRNVRAHEVLGNNYTESDLESF